MDKDSDSDEEEVVHSLYDVIAVMKFSIFPMTVLFQKYHGVLIFTLVLMMRTNVLS